MSFAMADSLVIIQRYAPCSYFINFSTGNLYYALTHSPVPLTEEYSYALTWEAATERLEAAGCITVKEAEAMEELHASDEAGIDVSCLLI